VSYDNFESSDAAL